MDTLQPSLTSHQLGALSTLALAQVGDAVFELMTRTALCQGGTLTAKVMHRCRVQLVSAPAQERAAALIIPLLTPEETAVFMRGRNTQVTHVPSSATREQYQAATALEALFGWLWLAGNRARLEELYAAAHP